MSPKLITGRGRVAAAAAIAVGLLTPYAAQADLNIVGSTHGQNYQGVANPVAGQAAASIPLSLCDAGGPMPERYQNQGNITDLTDANILIPAGNIVVWRCTVGGVPNFAFRYTGGFSAKGYGNIKAPYVLPPGTPNAAALFTTIVPGGTGCTAATGGNPKTDPGTGRQYNSFQSCSQKELVQADFATSDTKGTAFTNTMCDPQTVPSCASPISDTGIVSFPITATPFAMIVGNGVQKCDPVTQAAAGKITLTRLQVEAIFSGQVSSWNQLGYCVYPVQALSPPDGALGAGAGDMSPIGTPFNGSIDQSIVTCSRPVTAGTRIAFDATMMKDAAEVSYGTYTFPFNTDINYLAPTVADGLACVQGRAAAPTTPANNNAITYNRADESASPLVFGTGNVGRMRGGYPVPVDGALPSNYLAPAVLANPTSAERAVSQKEFRCGRYPFWSDWVGIQRTSGPANPNQALWNQYVAAIGTLLPKTTTGYFWARNVRQPGQPVNTEMSVTKGETKGPINFEPGDHPACR
ncbi:substrate-binding domain-containing protein [Nitrospira lenta]|uniref:Uncharacterized protein n=1 Tax=Nitrospira lenta TaxID=1436998 RepID=A0A330L0V6_9BACT|nr:substrate-binding domain-containing protein [Nitrospira lenta]SPP62967.1 exported hypothetical protein [Nitrospira lenta]